jgi:hypothetical protein
MNQGHRESFNSNEKYTQKFQFIRDDVFLIASIDPETRKQHLIFQKINIATKAVEFSDEMQCIQTAIAKICPEKYEQLMEDSDVMQNFINEALKKKTTDSVQFSKQLPKQLFDEDPIPNIDLNVDEKWFAFKSWVQGIAEAGMDALYLQHELDGLAKGGLPIVEFLYQNLMLTDASFIPQYLEKIEKECRFEGIYHKSSLHANLEIILSAIAGMDILDERKNFRDPSERCWAPLDESGRESIKNDLLFIAYIDPDYLFTTLQWRIRIFLAQCKEFIQFPQYKKLFTDENFAVRFAVAHNPDTFKLPDYLLLLNDESTRIKVVASKNHKII